MRIAVVGGTGLIGAHAVQLARAAGHDVLVLARSTGCDVYDGAGLDLSGVEAVIDVVDPGNEYERVTFFELASRHLQSAAQAGGVRHYVLLSTIGAAAHPYGRFAGKAVQEHCLAEGKIPWTILPTAPSYEFAEQHGKTIGGWVFVPEVLAQPLPARAIAERLLWAAESVPVGYAREFSGPDRLRLAEITRMVFQAREDPRPVIELPYWGRYGKSLRDGTLLPQENAEIGTVGYVNWLAEYSQLHRH